MSESPTTTTESFFTKNRILAIIAAIVAVLGIVTAYLTSGDEVVEAPVVVEQPVVIEEAPVAPETVVVPVSEENPTPALEIPVAPAPAE